jgi:tetrahydromethanopterin S-methyltransferase subunit G
MKIKLLKKIRKRYDWYFNTEKYPVLICHNIKDVINMDLEYCRKRMKFTLEEVKEKVKCDYTEWALRIMKEDIFRDYGISYSNLLYHKINKAFKNKQKKYKQYVKK